MDRAAFNAMLAQYATPEVSGNGRVSWDGGVRCVIPEVRLYGKCVQDGTPTPDAPVETKCNNGVFRATNAAGDYDGGQATAPELMVAVDGSCQSTFDTQTGKLTDWWWPEILLDGSENWRAYSTANWIGFYAEDALPEKMLRNAHWSNMFDPLKKGAFVSSSHIWCGVNNQNVFVVASPSVGFSFYNSSLDDKGLANWKAHLAEHPLHVRVARNEPLVTYAAPARLTQPPRSGQIIQLSGDVADCPITVKYLTHS